MAILDKNFLRLLFVSSGFRGADQLMVAGTPLVTAAYFGYGPDIVGLIVAIQGSAWLLISLPAGVWIDRIAPLSAMSRAMLLAVSGVVIAGLGLVLGLLPLFAAGAFVSASAAVIGFLSESASIQSIVPPQDLPQANSYVQIIQSCAMLLGPVIMGYAMHAQWIGAAYALALVFAVIGLGIALSFKPGAPPAPRPRHVISEVREGVSLVFGNPLLRGIVACAMFWNMAFFALTAIFVPFALSVVKLNAGQAGTAISAMGIGSMAAALTVAPALKRFSPRVILVFGPLSSVLAAVLLAFAARLDGFLSAILVFFLLGYGPILWFVCQNSIRQLVTPKGFLGRVGSVIQVAIYGVRSFGAILGGVVAAKVGYDAALAMIIGLFIGSTAAVFMSALIGLKKLPAPVGEGPA